MRHRHIALRGAAEGVIRQAFPDDEVTGFPDTLSVGPLADIGRPVSLYRRMLWLRTFLRCKGGTDDTAERCDRIASLLSVLPELDQATVWAGDHPDEQLMLYALAPFLPENTTVISVSRLLLRIAGTGTVMPDVLRMLKHQGATLDIRWREHLTGTWQALQTQNATLHFSLKGTIQAAREEGLDETIFQLARKGMSEAALTDAVMATSGMQVNRDWLTWRIRFLQTGMG